MRRSKQGNTIIGYFNRFNQILKNNPQRASYLYAFFLVYITPISLPLTLWLAMQSKISLTDLILLGALYSLSGIGITLGFHRLITHRSFQTTSWFKRLLLICGSFAMQGSPASWASIHIQHHRFADKVGDPHSPKQQGMWYAHCGWLFHDYRPNFRHYGKWLIDDPEVRHVSRYYFYYSNLSLLIPLLMGGWNGFVVAGLLRIFISSHVTWSVNSLCHRFGKRPYARIKDNSTNNVLIAMLSFGEGWHHNHHRFLQMPFFAHHWYQLDIGKLFLLFFKKLGLVWEFKIPKGMG